MDPEKSKDLEQNIGDPDPEGSKALQEMAKNAEAQDAINRKITELVGEIESGDAKQVKKMIKKSPTGLLKANSDDATRHKSGEKLVTYVGVNEDGSPKKETGDYAVATIKDDSVILRNEKPISGLDGKPLKGRYEGSEFIPDPEGEELLYNEYVSDEKFVETAYGVNPGEGEWKEALKLIPSYVYEVPDEMFPESGDITVTTGAGTEIKLFKGGVVAFDTKKGKVISVRGIEGSQLADTYQDYDEYLESIDKDKK